MQNRLFRRVADVGAQDAADALDIVVPREVGSEDHAVGADDGDETLQVPCLLRPEASASQLSSTCFFHMLGVAFKLFALV